MSTPSRIPQLVAAALTGAAVTGGGLALAARGPRPIHGCVVRRTHELLISRRCGRGQFSLTWNQRGPAGPAGPAGPTGPQAVGAWGLIAENSTTAGVNAGQNLSAVRTGVGTVLVTITGGPCANQASAVVATPETANTLGTAAPMVYVSRAAQPGPFTLTLGLLSGNSFTPSDGVVTANVAVYCAPVS